MEQADDFILLYYFDFIQRFCIFLLYSRTFCEERLHTKPEVETIFTPLCYFFVPQHHVES